MFPGPVPPRHEHEPVPVRSSSPPPPPPPLPLPPPSPPPPPINLEASPPEALSARRQLIREKLNEGPRAGGRWRGAALLVGSLVLFLAVRSGDMIDALVILIAVLFAHETGHYLGMRAFGYRDISMFFIPFLGAAVSGKKETAPAWQRGVVLLLGPLPGLLVGTGMYFVRHPGEGTWEHQLMTALLVLNAFNLLPFTPLDGGRLVELLLTHRRPLGGAIFRLVAVAGLGLIAYALQAWALGVVAGLMLLAIPAGFRASSAAVAFRRAHPDAPGDPRNLTDDQLTDLVAAVDRGLPEARSRGMVADWVQVIHGEATTPRPGGLAAALLLSGFTLGWGCTLAVWLASAWVANVAAAQAAYDQGVTHASQGRHDEAIAEYTKAIELFPVYPDALYGRAESRRMKKQYSAALADYSEAIQLFPEFARAFSGRGLLRYEQREYPLAVADLEEAVRLNPDDPESLRMRAWIRATSPDIRLRNGPGAVADAERANELTGWKDGYFLAAAAAAYAEVGRFDDAVRCQSKALEDVTHTESWGEVERWRLADYQQGKSLRDPEN